MIKIKDKTTGQIIEVETEAAAWELIRECEDYEIAEGNDGIL